MSVTMSLYKVRPDIEYKGYYLDFVGKDAFILGSDGLYGLERIEKDLGAPMAPDGHWPRSEDDHDLYWKHEEWEKNQKANAWSDGKEHDKLDISHLKACFKHTRGWKRLASRFEDMPIKTFKSARGIQRYIPVDEVQYAQGWFFKKRFFNKEITFVFCTTKEQMENFFKQYVDFNHPSDDRGKEAVNRFINAWEDGMIFECAW